jgi:asparagine synthase (glutamine-hydrolysing)
MCGITGAVWDCPQKAIDASILARMTDVLRHRGPDDQGQYTADLVVHPGYATVPGIALGHRRLSIIDLAGGHQPLGNEDGTIQIVFNGEIYNHASLRHRLEGTGHRFRTRSDTEVIVHLYEDEGPECLGLLNGMFALAIWDATRRQLLLARDRMGEKPLVYCHQPGRLLFASQLKSLLEAPDVPREIDPRAVDLYLTYQYVPHPWTIWKGIAKLPPACYALYRDGKLEIRRYWQPDCQTEIAQPAAEYARQLRELLADAVALRMESEVPLGAFLSGGVDSSIVVGLMAQAAREPVRTFSIGFPVREYDETHYAATVARRFGTIHEQFRVEPNAVEVLPELVWHYDEPMADSSAIPTWYLSRLTRQHVTVALTGDGGDELFVGYPRYRAVWLAGLCDRLPWPLRPILASRLWQGMPASVRQKSLRRRAKRFLEALGQPVQRRYLEWIATFNESYRGDLYTDEFLASLPDADPLDFLSAAYARSADRDVLTATSLADAWTYLPCDILTKVDVASMAHGLECRSPFLDHRVVELAAGMPIARKFRFGVGKRILREAFHDLLPRPIQRRGKMGFGVPLDHWFRGPLAGMAREILLDPRTLQRGLFRPAAVQGLLEAHVSGRFDHSYRLWSLLVLELWQRKWRDATDLTET